MSSVQRHVVVGVGVSVGLAIILMLSVFMTFPLEDWSALWEQSIYNLPFILFIPLISIAFGIVSGIAFGLYWKKQFNAISEALRELEQGRPIHRQKTSAVEDAEPIWSRLDKIQKQMIEQTKQSQKLANEKAEDQEKRIQDMITQERNRLARDLHDSVSQQLFAASMLMSAVTESKPDSEDRESKQLKLVEQTIQQSQLEMRALLLHLRPVALKGKTLQEGMRELLNELLEKVPMKIQWKIEEFPLDKGIEDHLFRILQESISNTLRHSKATTVEVLLVQREELIILRVVDDGVGFDVEESKTGSYGLQNMHERAIEVGGTTKIVSVKNKGTRLEVKVPMIRVKDDEND